MTDKEAMAMALEALECANSPNGDYENEIAALKERLAQRTWVGLTEEDRAEILSRKWWDFEDEFDVDGFLRLAEAKLKEKNT